MGKDHQGETIRATRGRVKLDESQLLRAKPIEGFLSGDTYYHDLLEIPWEQKLAQFRDARRVAHREEIEQAKREIRMEKGYPLTDEEDEEEDILTPKSRRPTREEILVRNERRRRIEDVDRILLTDPLYQKLF